MAIDVLEFSSTKYEIQSTKGRGRGVFALKQFRPGELVMEISGQVISDPEYTSLYCMDLGRGRVLEPGIPGALINHSCDPNCQLIEVNKYKVGIEALVNIQPGRELTYDYGWPAEVGAQKCYCGAYNCRGYIVAADELSSLRRKLKKKSRKRKPR